MYSVVLSLAWALFTLVLMLVLMQPIGIGAQAFFGLCAIAIMLVVHLFSLKGPIRHLFILTGCTIALRYLYWRVTSTLPSADDLVSFIPGMLLLFAEFYSIGMLFLNALVTADPIKRKFVPLTGDKKDYPTVDVMIPSYNEDDDILFTTVAAAKNLDYPTDKLNIFLLDDGGTDQKCNSDNAQDRNEALERRARLTKFCEELGVNYLTRAKNEMAKAGNLNNGLENSNGDLVVIFDADHAPVREFLTRTIGYLQNDSSLFLVQTPHFFMNADPVEKNLDLHDRMPSENEMFYTVTQKGLDKWDASFFCGSAAILRRKALNEVDGFKGMSITEDCETALELHSRGWSSAYIDEALIVGFQPETVSSFLVQRSRWCQGMLQLLILKTPLFKKGLRPMQRAAYLSSMLFWLFPLSRLAFLYAPALYIFFNLEIYNASFQEFLVYTGTFMIASTIFQNYLFGKVRWPWVSETYEYIQSLALIKTIFSTILSPRKPIFKVTDKGTSLEHDFFASQGWSFLISHLFLIATFLVGLYRMHSENYSNELLLVVTFWAGFNAILGGLALGVCAEKRERRRHYRIEPSKHGLSSFIKGNQGDVQVELLDLAIGGVSLKLLNNSQADNFSVGDTMLLRLAKGTRNASGQEKVHELPLLVKWSSSKNGDQMVGLGFDKLSARDRRFIAYLMLANAGQIDKKRTTRKKYRSVIIGTATIVGLSFVQAIRGFKSALTAIIASPNGKGTSA